jgi:hypothetical protein
MKWSGVGQRRDLLGYTRRWRRYVASYSYVSNGERPVQSIQAHPGTIWRGIRGRRIFRSLVFQVRDNNVYVVYVSVGGAGIDTIATICSRGPVVSVTVHLQCD